MSETETEAKLDCLAAYDHGYRDGMRYWWGALLLGFFLAVWVLGAFIMTCQKQSYRQGQIDAYNGIQHFYPVTQERETITEWFDDRERKDGVK